MLTFLGLISLLPAAGSAPENSSFPHVSMSASCAPWDGPAIAIEFSHTPLQCGKPRTVELTIALWKELPPRSGQTIPLDANAKAGQAAYCPGEGKPCELATTGSVHFDTFVREKRAVGNYNLIFPKAGRLTGSFRADWCHARILCG
jgi:hypothetical protein